MEDTGKGERLRENDIQQSRKMRSKTIEERVLEMTALTVPGSNMKLLPSLRSLFYTRTDHKSIGLAERRGTKLSIPSISRE